MGEPRAGHTADLGSLAGPDDLRLAREATQRGGVQHARTVAGERAAPRRPSVRQQGAFLLLSDKTSGVVLAVPGGHVARLLVRTDIPGAVGRCPGRVVVQERGRLVEDVADLRLAGLDDRAAV